MWLFLLACGGGDPAQKVPAETPTPNLTERLGPGEARAGVVTDEAALFGGISAEGQLGDVKIYNQYVQFIVQGARKGSYYFGQGGGLIDMDLVRPSGMPGRDVVDEMSVMVGLGRLAEADSVVVEQDGSDGGPAVVRVDAHGSAMQLLSGVFENPEFIDDFDVAITTWYTLPPDSHLIELKTEIEWRDEETPVQVGDVTMISFDVAERWHPGMGLDEDGTPTGEWYGIVGMKNEVAVALLSKSEPWPSSVIQDLLAEIGPVLAGIGSSVTLSEGDTLTLERFIGVGPDLATLTDAWYAERGVSTETVAGTVTADGAGLAGARVHVHDADGAPLTMAVTDVDGAWSAQVPAGTAATAIATGRGGARFTDLPAGAGWSSAYAGATATELTLTSLREGSAPIPFAEGYGVSEVVAASASTTHALAAPGQLTVRVADGLPAVVEVAFTSGDSVSRDPRTTPSRPSGRAAIGYARDGEITLPVEPGDYTLLVHRGLRWEYATETVSIASSESVSAELTLDRAFTHPGVLVIDPHSHGAPSGDGGIPMEDRLVVHASNGVDVHFGTDHDHVADYRPLVDALGLSGVLRSVVADEVSPVMKGHFNAYPLEVVPDRPNNGAVPWWELENTTDELMAEIRAAGGDLTLVQSNHPNESSGLLTASDYDRATGTYDNAEKWTTNFDCIEVLNDGDYEETFPNYLDMVSRGLFPTPVGVSDAHGYGGVGESVTFLNAGVDTPAALTDALLVSALRDHATVVSLGPYLSATVDGAWAPGQTLTGSATLEVEILSASWVVVDTLTLYENTVAIEVITLDDDTTTASFTLNPAADAAYTVVASGSQAMAPVYPGRQPWAMTAPVLVDVDGDGWDSPLPDIAAQ